MPLKQTSLHFPPIITSDSKPNTGTHDATLEHSESSFSSSEKAEFGRPLLQKSTTKRKRTYQVQIKDYYSTLGEQKGGQLEKVRVQGFRVEEDLKATVPTETQDMVQHTVKKLLSRDNGMPHHHTFLDKENTLVPTQHEISEVKDHKLMTLVLENGRFQKRTRLTHNNDSHMKELDVNATYIEKDLMMRNHGVGGGYSTSRRKQKPRSAAAQSKVTRRVPSNDVITPSWLRDDEE